MVIDVVRVSVAFVVDGVAAVAVVVVTFGVVVAFGVVAGVVVLQLVLLM